MGEVRAQVDGAGAAAARFGRMRVRLALAVDRAPNEAADATVPAYQAAAPVRSGALQRNIHAEGNEVVSTVANPDDGFHYTRVTRFGHLPAEPDRIYPHGRLPQQVSGRFIAGDPNKPERHALHFDGKFFASVKRYHPASDWAQRAHEPAGRLAKDRFGRLIRDAVGS